MSARPKTVYATVPAKDGSDLRISGTLGEATETHPAQVLVSTRTYHIGWFNLDRFEGGKLTAGTLRKMFAPGEQSA